MEEIDFDQSSNDWKKIKRNLPMDLLFIDAPTFLKKEGDVIEQ